MSKENTLRILKKIPYEQVTKELLEMYPNWPHKDWWESTGWTFDEFYEQYKRKVNE